MMIASGVKIPGSNRRPKLNARTEASANIEAKTNAPNAAVRAWRGLYLLKRFPTRIVVAMGMNTQA